MPPATVDATAVFEAIADINKSVQAGFKEVHEKINNRFVGCDRRFIKLETRKAVDEALKEREEKNVDFWMWGVRAVYVAGVIALFAIAYQTAFPTGTG